MTSRISSFGQRLAWRVEALAYDLASAVLRSLPVDQASDLGAAVFRKLGPLTPQHRIAERNIGLAFPELDAAGRQALLKAQWESLGRTFFEFPLTDRLTPASGRVEVIGGERLAEIAADRRPVVLISGHFSNWEVMAAVIVASGVDCQVTYRAANNPLIDRRIMEGRARYGIRLFAPKGGDGGRELLKAMAAGQSVALLNDQKFSGGVRVPFFGHAADTAAGPTRLAMKFGAALVPMTVERTEGARFRVTIHPEIAVSRTGDRSADIEAGVKAVSAFVEAQIRRRPHEWFWVHRRWPKETYRDVA